MINVCDDHLNKNFRDYGYQVVFLAKNKNGYNNLSKLSSLAYTKGFYYVPRVDKNLVIDFSLAALHNHLKKNSLNDLPHTM